MRADLRRLGKLGFVKGIYRPVHEFAVEVFTNLAQRQTKARAVAGLETDSNPAPCPPKQRQFGACTILSH
ncbi:MAG: hypothetical protein NTAFB05_04940 [Nitrobacter sp.]